MVNVRKYAASCILILITLSFLNLNNLNIYALETLIIDDETLLDGGFEVLPDGDGNFFFISYDKNSTKSAISYLDNSSETPTLKKLNLYENRTQSDSLNYKFTTANYYNGIIYLTYIKSNNVTTIERLKVKLSPSENPSDTYSKLESRDINNIIDSPEKIAISKDDYFFILNENSKNSIDGYDINEFYENVFQSEQIYSFIDMNITRNILYAADNYNNLMRYNVNNGDYKFEKPISTINFQNLKFLTDNVFVTVDGHICILNSSESKLNSNTQTDAEIKNYPTCVTAGLDESFILAKTDDKTISCIRCSDGVVTSTISLNEKILALSTSKDKILAVTNNENNKVINLISATDIVEKAPEAGGDENNDESNDNNNEDNDNNNNDENNKEDNNSNNKENDESNNSNDKDNSNTESGDNTQTDDDAITSDIHDIDTENLVISNISAGTTFAEFKNNLIFNGYSLVFKDSTGKVKTGNSTKIATGYSVTFVKDGIEKITFKLIVKGDLTGTGTLTSRDISTFVNYLLGKTTLDNNYLQAADINDDGEPDTIDLFLIYKLLQK